MSKITVLKQAGVFFVKAADTLLPGVKNGLVNERAGQGGKCFTDAVICIQNSNMILDLLKRVCKGLEEAEIPYMLSGSLALNVYTVPRMTRDIDIVINLYLHDIERFAKIFEQGFYIFKEGIPEEVKRRGMFNIIDYQTGNKIDFILRKHTEFHIAEFERRRKVNIFGFNTWIVSPEDLVIAKLNWIQVLQSDMQKMDIQNLLEMPDIDKVYIVKWCKHLNLNTFNLLSDAGHDA